MIGALLCQGGAFAQPNAADKSTYTIEELERFIGGRTLISIDVKNASMKEVAEALSQSTGLKVLPFSLPAPAPPRLDTNAVAGGKALTAPGGAPQVTPVIATLPVQELPFKYSLSTTNKPFWEAMRDWHLEARHAAEAQKKEARLKAVAEKKPFYPQSIDTLSFDLWNIGKEWQMRPGTGLANGRATSNWPLLLIATKMQRTQGADISQTGLEEAPLPDMPRSFPGDDKIATLPAESAPEEKRWLDQLALTTYTLADPKLAPTKYRFEILEAFDDIGNDLRPVGNAVKPFSGTQTGMGTPIFVMLASKPEMGKKLVKLRGIVHFSVLTRTQHWETDELDKPVTDTVQFDGGEFKINFDGLKPQGNGWSANFSATSQGKHLERFWRSRFGSGNVSQGPSNGILDFSGLPPVRLVDENGLTVMGSGRVSGFSIGSKLPRTETRNFPPMAKPVKLIVDFPIERREVSVPFEFTDVPLPPS
ncbi:hypothetical protein EON80_15795 [bacterium]|nr:MAG: hypothetical protein EON80_15795 [bacterium]